MTPLKNKVSQKPDVFGEKFWKKIFSYFPKIFSQIFFDCDQFFVKDLILRDRPMNKSSAGGAEILRSTINHLTISGA